uniref:CPBP family intramembrane metalloprotease n=1 Tax=Thermofilum pendens TaxID=2269 RepID=A0A7C3SM01_THEPE
MAARLEDLLLVLLPLLLFTVPFVLFPDVMVLAMGAVAPALAAAALTLRRGIAGSLRSLSLPASLACSLLLYLVFLAGGLLSRTLGMWWQVERVYSSLTYSPLEVLLIALIGFSEEVYWRGYLQEDLLVSRLRAPWWLSSLPYSLVHLVSGMPLLVLAALPVGVVMGFLARRWGVGTSALAHTAWLYIVLYLAPVPVVLGVAA